MYNKIQAGDFVFIEFAHNDDASKSAQTMIDRLVPLGVPDQNGVYPCHRSYRCHENKNR